ncbi:MAG: SLBB domain-containing protein [bacterium]|nr:SLBB domain-containing protein [bacterium]
MFSSLLLSLIALVPGDAIAIKSTNYKELNDTIFVLGDTTAELPYIGRVNVAFIDESNIREYFIETYSKYLKEPDIAVFVLYRISIIGRVNKPGIYYLPSFASFGDLIAISGGPLPDANLSRIKVYSGSKKTHLNFRKTIIKNLKLNDLGIVSGTVVEVPKKFTIGLEDIYKFAATTGILWSVYKEVIAK